MEPVVLELITGGTFFAFGLHFDAAWDAAAFDVLGAGLIALSTIDLHIKRLPREITYVTAAIGVPLLVVAALVDHEQRRLVTAVIGAALSLAFMAALFVLSRGGMGDGDVRLSPLLGAYLGWLGLGFVPIGLFLGFLLGSIVGVAALVIGKAGRKTAIPFGPFLAAGTVIAVFTGRSIIDRLWPA